MERRPPGVYLQAALERPALLRPDAPHEQILGRAPSIERLLPHGEPLRRPADIATPSAMLPAPPDGPAIDGAPPGA